MKKLRPRLSVIALSALGMMLGQCVAGYLPSSLARPNAEARPGKSVLSAHELEIVGADAHAPVSSLTTSPGVRIDGSRVRSLPVSARILLLECLKEASGLGPTEEPET